MKNITLPEELEYIGECCFYESGLEQVNPPPALKVVDENAFYQCEGLKSVVFSNGLEKIGLFAFYKTGLESIKLPGTLRTVAQGAFAQCEHLKTVEFEEGLEVLGTDEYPDDGGMWYGAF